MSSAPTAGEGARHLVTIGPEAEGERLDRALALALPELSRSRIKALIEAGSVESTASGDARRTISEPSMRVKSGHSFAVFVPEPEDAKPAAQAIDLDVVYEDEDLIVIDKPAGLVVHPAAGNPDGTLVNALIAHCGDSLSGIGGERRPGIVHRLDKDTSGLMVAAKNDRAHAGLAAQFEAHSLERAYTALVWGVPRPSVQRVEGNIGRDPKNRKRMAVVKSGGKRAVTNVKVLRSFGDAASLVECRLETGRTHQIRVHLAKIGHPVIGDPLYGRITSSRRKSLPELVQNVAVSLDRQALHAHLIGFEHPSSKNMVKFESKLPSDISVLLTSLEGL